MNRLFKIAVKCNSKILVDHYLKKGHELNDLDSKGMSLLMYASARNYADICGMLLEAGADPCVRNSSGETAITLAKQKGSHEAGRVISEHVAGSLRTTENSGALDPVTISTGVTSIKIKAVDNSDTGSTLRSVCETVTNMPDSKIRGQKHWLDSLPDPPESQDLTLVDPVTIRPDPEEQLQHVVVGNSSQGTVADHHRDVTPGLVDSDNYSANHGALLITYAKEAAESGNWRDCRSESANSHKDNLGTDLGLGSFSKDLSIPTENSPVLDPEVNCPAIDHDVSIIEIDAWQPLTESMLPESDTSGIRAQARIQSDISGYLPEDDGEDWSEAALDIGAFSEIRLSPVDLLKEETRDTLLKISYTGMTNGRLFRQQFCGLWDEFDLEEEHPVPLLELALGQAGIIIDDTDPQIAATDETGIDLDIVSGPELDAAHALIEFFEYLTENNHDPLSTMLAAIYESKPLERNEGPNLARMMEQGYREILEAIVDSPFIMSRFHEHVNVDTDSEDAPEDVCYEETVTGDEPDPEDLSFDVKHAFDDAVNDSHDLFPVDAESFRSGEARFREEIARIIDEYSIISLRFQSRTGSQQSQATVLSNIAERLYKAGVPLQVFQNLYDSLSGLMNGLLRNEHELAGAPSPIKTDLFVTGISSSNPDTRLLLNKYLMDPDALRAETELSLDQFRSSFLKYEKGLKKINYARTCFVQKNLRLVAFVAKSYRKSALPYADILQEGAAGLLMAIDRYRYQTGYRFSTYAIHWIRQAIARAIHNQGRLIRIPVHVSEHAYKFNKLRRICLDNTGVEPDEQFLMNSMKISRATLMHLYEIPEVFVPFDDPDTEDLISRFIGSCPVEDEVFSHMLDQSLSIQVGKLLDSLGFKESLVLKMRFGIGYDHPHTLDAIGQELNLTRERIRQIESKALNRCRKPLKSRLLRPFVEG